MQIIFGLYGLSNWSFALIIDLPLRSHSRLTSSLSNQSFTGVAYGGQWGDSHV